MERSRISPRTSTPAGAGVRAGLLGVATLILILAVGGSPPGGVSVGHAIKGDGPLPFGTIGFSQAKQGAVYRFSFPLLDNVSKAPLRVTSWRVLSIPSGVKPLGYSVYSYDDTPGYLLNGTDSTYRKYPDYARKRFIIPPRTQSSRYPNLRVRVVGKITDHIHDCEIGYTQKGHKYIQVLDCDYALDGT
jgi:hypothetical protein